MFSSTHDVYDFDDLPLVLSCALFEWSPKLSSSIIDCHDTITVALHSKLNEKTDEVKDFFSILLQLISSKEVNKSLVMVTVILFLLQESGNDQKCF